MNWHKIPERKLYLCLLVSLTLLPALAYPITTAGQFTILGNVESVERDFKFIVVNKVKILITSETRITNEGGKSYNKEGLKANLPVTIEVIQKPEGLVAKKIVVKGIKKN